jgi:excisionase family DNA binding protein
MDKKTTPPYQDVLLASGQVQQLLGLSRTTIWRLTRTGALPAVRIGAALRYRRSDVLALMEVGAPQRS